MNSELITAKSACPKTIRSFGIPCDPAPVRKLAYGKFEKLSRTECIVEIDYPNADIFSCFRVMVGYNAPSLFDSAYALATARAAEHGYELATLSTIKK
jgi:hypothetical protein